ncbi:MAG: hypothetical protein JNK87_40250 [Bryobacterales bacterium]|nr:hypothetical protein [Bryobacterales bacterium]
MAELTDSVLSRFSSARFEFAEDISSYFGQRKGTHYLAWFNQTVADKSAWKGKKVLDTPANRVGFHQFWNNIPLLFDGPASMVQFAALMGIISNETSGSFTPISERSGIAGHPGISYLFNAIPGLKRSYNTLSGNKTAYDCFHDAVFIQTHGALPLADRLTRTADDRWRRDAYPQTEFPTRLAAAECGFILETDFVKFRGRGLIQTTGRANYLRLIRWIQTYNGENSTIDFYRTNWRDRDPDEVATESTNEDWDRLFQQSDLEVACRAIQIHSESSSRYLNLGTTAAVLNAPKETKGSLRHMGWRISGGAKYADTYYDRMVELLSAI